MSYFIFTEILDLIDPNTDAKSALQAKPKKAVHHSCGWSSYPSYSNFPTAVPPESTGDTTHGSCAQPSACLTYADRNKST